jgi:triacylglycerol esterase/lipase EstA (alpha/beta hydrolase family)
MNVQRIATFLAAAMAILLTAPGLARAQTYPPVDTAGPALSVSQTALDAALECSADLTGAMPKPVLLVPGTSLTPEKNYGWNWIPALDDLNREWCTVTLPGSSMADIQIAGEYVVNAVRKMYEDHGATIDVLGHSQGGMVPRWALRFWPDTRAMVDDLVGIAPSNHGTTASAPNLGCPFQGCAPAIWQQLANAGFIAALNSHQETFSGIDYTAIYTKLDDVVQPNADDTGSSSIRPNDTTAITNVAVQDVCTDPNAPYTNHAYVGTVNNAAYLLAIDALDNTGPANPTRPDFTGAACTDPMPGVDTMTGFMDAADAQSYSNNTIATHPKVTNEPYVACYAVTPCGPPPPGPGGGSGDGGGATQPTATGRRAAAIKKCKKKKGRARAKCLKKAKRLPL